MDKQFFISRKVVFSQVVIEKKFDIAMQILKEIIEADLEVNFRVESSEENFKKQRNSSVINGFRHLIGNDFFDLDSD